MADYHYRRFYPGQFIFIFLITLIIFFHSPVSLAVIADNQTNAVPTKKVTLQLKWKHAFQFAGYYAALEKGFYRAEGLDVVIREHNGYQAPVDALLAGNADFAITGADVLVSRVQGNPVVALGAIFQHSPYALLVLESSKIKEFEDLAGKKIMLNNGSQDAILHASLRRAGLTDKYLQVQNSFDINDLINGNVAAFSAYVTDQGYRLQKQGYDYRYLLPTQYGIDFYGDILTTTDSMINNHPKIVKAFRDASFKGWEYALNHHEEIIKLILEKYNTQNLTHDHLDYEANAMREFIQPLLVNIGYMHYQRWNHIKNIFIETGIIKKSVSIDGLMYQSDTKNLRVLEIIQENIVIIILITLLIICLIFMLIISHMRRIIGLKAIEIKNQEETYRKIFSRAPMGIWVMDENQRTTEINQKLTEILGYSSYDLLGKSPYEIVDDENREIIKFQLDRIPVTDYRYYEAAFIHKKGHNVPVRISGMTLRNSAYELTSSLAFIEDISSEKQMHERIEQSELQLRTLIDTEPACVKTLDHNLRLLSMNKAGLEMIQADSFESVFHEKLTSLINEEDRQAFIEMSQSVLNGEGGTLIFKATGLKGKKIFLETRAVPLRDNHNKINRILALTHDVTARIELENVSRSEKEFLQSVIDGIGDSVMVINMDYSVRLMNAAATKNLTETNIEHFKCYQIAYGFNQPCYSSNYPCPLRSVYDNQSPVSVIHNVAQENHSFRRLELVTTPLINKDGEFSGVIEISRDITEHLELLQELQTHKENLDHLTLHDPLTNLPNRTLLLNKLEQLIIKTQGTHKSIAVLFIDLDHFKQINDSLGHAFGDQILEMASERFYQCVDINDTVARLGGDEFAIILESLSQGQNSALMAQNIIKAMEKPFEIELHQLYLTASIGISLYPQDGIDAQTLLRNADAAMYKAKDEGRNTFQFYTESMTEQAFERILMDVSLRKALSKDELLVYYQPQFDLKTRKIVGVEALVRWNHPDLGLVLPDRFISVAEETGLIIPLGNIVMEKAFHQISQWNHQFDTNLKVAVNISVRQIFDARFIANLKQLLSKTQCNPKWLELEVTEGLIMDKPEVSIKIMEQIRAIGIDLAIDDFGTGYSSLSYLKRFPITRLKIDSSFIRDIPDDVDDIAITNAIIALGKSLNISIIAEGIETDAQNNYLINEGCQFGQGFIYSRPLAASEMSLLLQKQSQKQLSS